MLLLPVGNGPCSSQTRHYREARTNKVDLLLVLILLLLLFGGGGGLWWGFGVGWGIGPIGLIIIVIIVAWLLFGYRGRRGPRL